MPQGQPYKEKKRHLHLALKKKCTFLNFMDILCIPLILNNSDKQAGGLTELEFNHLCSCDSGRNRDVQRDNQRSVWGLMDSLALIQEPGTIKKKKKKSSEQGESTRPQSWSTPREGGQVSACK